LKLGDALQYYLANDATIDNIVDGRVYAIHAPQDAEFPLITFQHIGGTPLPHLNGEDMATLADRYQIQAWAKTLEEAQDIGVEIKLAVRAAGRCSTDFGFADLVPTLFKIGDSTYVRFGWNTSYDMEEKQVKWKAADAGTIYTVGPDDTSGTSHTIDGEHAVGRGDYEWWAWSKNACGVWGESTTQTFTITKTLFGDEITVT